MAAISLSRLFKRFGKTDVIHGIDLDIADGEFVVLVGPSGCGKSTTLRIIAGLEDATGGDILIGGRNVNRLEPKDRNIAMVFQNYAIYPHMSVEKNIAFGLRMSPLPAADKAKRVREVADILGLTPLLERRPNQLSGGQRQRVAIGRAMVRNPVAFLFDEPLSNLDAQLRTQMRLEIKKLHQRLGTTIVFVTHDQVEAMTLADRIVIMKDGHILQVGTPTEVYRHPATAFVARFIGSPSMNMLPGTGTGNGLALDGGIAVPLPAGGSLAGTRLHLGIRPDDLRVVATVPPGAIGFEATVSVIEPLGPDTLVYAQLGGMEIVAKAPARTPLGVGQRVLLAANPDDLHLFDAASERAIPLAGRVEAVSA
jgi:multiple sugar transport system ATP-binding protein